MRVHDTEVTRAFNTFKGSTAWRDMNGAPVLTMQVLRDVLEDFSTERYQHAVELLQNMLTQSGRYSRFYRKKIQDIIDVLEAPDGTISK